MKRMMIIAAAFAALVSCSKSETSQNPSTEPGTEETPAAVEYAFTEGETVTITAGASLTKVSSALDTLNTGKVDFKWQSGDKIKVTVGGTSSEFTVSELLDGGKNAKFTGKMPADGTTFSVQYPVNYSGYTEQTYTSGEAIPHDAMKFTAEECTVKNPFTLTAQYAALRLNLYGTDQTIGKIEVADTTGGEYCYKILTLTCTGGKKIGTSKSASTPFLMVFPAGNYAFQANIFDENNEFICSFGAKKTLFTANQIRNMSAKEVKKAESVLLPGEFSVSASKKVKFTKGNLWCNTTTTSVEWHLEKSQTAYPTSWNTSHVGHFYWSKDASVAYANEYSDDACATSDKFFCDGSDDAHKLTVDDQGGLYALSKEEWCYLLNYDPSLNDGKGGFKTDKNNVRYGKFKYGVTVNSVGNCLVIAPDNYSGTLLSEYSETTDPKWSEAESNGLVCLPAAGYRNGSSLCDGDYPGNYWSATPYGSLGDDKNFAYDLYFNVYYVLLDSYDRRDCGQSVRLVSSVSK